MIPKISYIFPSRSREKKFFEALANINDMSDSKEYEIICALDEDDVFMNNEGVREKIKEYDNVKYYYGYSGSKVAACNREAHRVSDDTSIICLHSDDMVFLEYGFDDVIRDAFKQHFPNLDGVVHFPDENARDRTMTYTMMGVNLYRQLGYLYHPDFESVYPDNHITEMTRQMGKYAFVDRRILNHLHPIWQLGEWDSQYRHSERPEVYQKDHQTFERHKANNFYL